MPDVLIRNFPAEDLALLDWASRAPTTFAAVFSRRPVE